MAYADRTDLGRYGVSPDLLAQIPTEAQDQSLAAASDEADDCLRERFDDLPLSEWTLSLRKRVAQMAAYDLVVVRGLFNIDSSDKELRTRYEKALAWLSGCSLGQITPGGRGAVAEGEDEGAEPNEGGAAVASRTRRRSLG